MLIDARFTELAKTITDYSLKLRKDETVLIEACDIPENFVMVLMRVIRERGAIPFLDIRSSRLYKEWLKETPLKGLQLHKEKALAQMKEMDAYIALRGTENVFETSDVPAKTLEQAAKILKPVQDWRVEKTRWVVLRWPTPSMAQQARMSTEAFEDLFFQVCTFDYKKITAGMNALKRLMEKTDRVHIKGPGTDLEFSIKGIPSVVCNGQFNLPDGEVFTAPVKESVEGILQYNAPTIYQGCSFDNVVFEFKKGKIIKASASDTKRLNSILDSDPGARYIGEFALGCNPCVQEPMRDILFDEKITGSFHFTPGQAYEIADNGNRSQVHWDIVCIQRSSYGGGEIYFDGTLIRKDGIFLPKSLHSLNG